VKALVGGQLPGKAEKPKVLRGLPERSFTPLVAHRTGMKAMIEGEK